MVKIVVDFIRAAIPFIDVSAAEKRYDHLVKSLWRLGIKFLWTNPEPCLMAMHLKDITSHRKTGDLDLKNSGAGQSVTYLKICYSTRLVWKMCTHFHFKFCSFSFYPTFSLSGKPKCCQEWEASPLTYIYKLESNPLSALLGWALFARLSSLHLNVFCSPPSPPFRTILFYSDSWPLASLYSIAIIYLQRAVNCCCSVTSWKQIWVSAGGAAGGALTLPLSNFCLTKSKSSAGFSGGV